MHAGLDLVRSELEGHDESASVVVISPETVKMIGQIFVASESAIEILNDLLNYEHIDAGRLPPTKVMYYIIYLLTLMIIVKNNKEHSSWSWPGSH